VIHPCAYRFKDYVDLGVVQPWDTSQIPNYSQLNPTLEAFGQIDGKQYFIVEDWGFIAPLYRADKVQPQEDSWSLLWDERYAKRIAWIDTLEKAKTDITKEHEEVVELGGLYVLGTERHESRRIDNQLRGRSGRQGDPGESRFYLSLEDELMRLFATGLMSRVMNASFPDDVPLESKMVSRSVERAQGTVEDRNFEIRKNVLKYDEVMNEQRKIIYRRRQQILDQIVAVLEPGREPH